MCQCKIPWTIFELIGKILYRVSHNIGPTLYFVIFLDSRAQTAQTDYNDIFGDNPQEIAKIGRQLKTKHDKLKKIVWKKPDAPAASVAASTIISDDNFQALEKVFMGRLLKSL